MSDPSGPGKSKKQDENPWRYAHVGFQLILTFMLGLGVGFLLDIRYDTFPWMILVGSFLGFVLGMYHLIKVIK